MKKLVIFALVLTVAWATNGYADISETMKKEILSKATGLSVPFIANTGQSDKRFPFYADTFGGRVSVASNGEIVYSIQDNRYDANIMEGHMPVSVQRQSQKEVTLKESLLGGKVKKIKGESESITKVNYFTGNDPSNWKTGIPTYDVVSLGEVYNGIEYKLKAHGNNVEKLYYLSPWAKAGDIKIKLKGAKSLKVNKAGELEADTKLGLVKFTKPVAYQEVEGKKKFVEVAYALNGTLTYGFKVKDYDHTKNLVIDPLLASTFMRTGPSVVAIATDSNGNPIVATSTGIFKFDSNLTTLLASTYVNGVISAMAIDASGNVFITGSTTYYDFPTTSSAFDTSFNGGYSDVFVSKLSNDLSSLLASTFIGGTDSYHYYDPYYYDHYIADTASSIAIDNSGNILITGSTYSADFPVTNGAYDTSYNGANDIFVSKFNNNLSTLLGSTFIGGSNYYFDGWNYYGDSASSIAIDASDNIFITGSTYSADYPATSGAYDTLHNGATDVFVSKFDNNLSTLVASTFIGGGSYDNGGVLAINSSGNIYVAGNASAGYPTTAGAYNTSDVGSFISKMDNNLSNLLASTFVSSCGAVKTIALNATGNVYMTGWRGDGCYYPVTPDAYDPTYNGARDVILSKFDGNLSTLLNSTVIGGQQYEEGNALAFDSSGNVFVGGITFNGCAFCNNLTMYPTTPGAYYEPTWWLDYVGSYGMWYGESFISKLDGNLSSVDTDGDGTYDPLDNCPLVYNPNQQDSDINGIGDVCQDLDGDGYTAAVDCDDNDPLQHPNQVWYKDADNDGYSDGTTSTQCSRPSGYKLASELIATSGDCLDSDTSYHPDAPESVGADHNCNGITVTSLTYTASTKRLVVEASSTLGQSANLLLNGSNMTWNAGQSKWTKTLTNAPASPNSATVSGTQGADIINY